MTTKIKICGITNQADAELALDFGVDLLGFNFYRPSPRYIEPCMAAEIISSLPRQDVAVGLFVNAQMEFISEVLEQCSLHIVQLHGNESNDYCRTVQRFGPAVMKALRIRRPDDIKQADEYDTEFILLDAFREELYGGTGERFDWNWIGSMGSEKVFLAGGISPDNIEEALAVGTYGIDLCSGVENKPGIKDRQKMKALFEKITKC